MVVPKNPCLIWLTDIVDDDEISSDNALYRWSLKSTSDSEPAMAITKARDLPMVIATDEVDAMVSLCRANGSNDPVSVLEDAMFSDKALVRAIAPVTADALVMASPFALSFWLIEVIDEDDDMSMAIGIDLT